MKILLILLLSLQWAYAAPSNEKNELLNKIEAFSIRLPQFENAIASLFRGEIKLEKVAKANDELILALENLLNHHQIETVSRARRVQFRGYSANYMTLRYLGPDKALIDLLDPRLKKFLIGPNIEAIVHKLLAPNIENVEGFPWAYLLLTKAYGQDFLFQNRYEASLFSNSTISPTPQYNNYLDTGELYAAIDTICVLAKPLLTAELTSKSKILQQFDKIDKTLEKIFLFATDLQRLSSSFADTARKLAKSQKIDFKELWNFSNGYIKIVDEKKFALYSFVDKSKKATLLELQHEIEKMNKWLIRHDLYELLGEEGWMQTGLEDLAQTSNFKAFQTQYNAVLSSQQKLLDAIAKEQEKLNQQTLMIKTQRNHLWQEIYQLREALKDNDPKELKTPLQHFYQNLQKLKQ